MLMKKIKLTQGKYALVDDEDFACLSKSSWQFDKGNGNPRARRTVWINGKSHALTMHRDILKAKPGQIVDHINGNSLDNRKSNLRFCTRRQNRLNARAKGKSGFRGVERKRKKWAVVVYPNGKPIRLGLYKTKREAAKAYDNFAKKSYGKFARFNLE